MALQHLRIPTKKRHTFISVLQGHKQTTRSLKLKSRNLIRLFQVSGLYFNLVSLVLISDALHYMFLIFSHILSLCSFRSQATISNIWNCFLKLHVVFPFETRPKLGRTLAWICQYFPQSKYTSRTKISFIFNSVLVEQSYSSNKKAGILEEIDENKMNGK